MAADRDQAALVPVPEIREYPRINAEVRRLLDSGSERIILTGAEGQRLLLAGLQGQWIACIEVEGHAGPELAAGLDAPGLTVVCRGSAADGAGRALRAGTLIIVGSAGEAVGYTQAGGAILVIGAAGHRAGLDQQGGTLVLLGGAGRLCGERQAGGQVFAIASSIGPHGGYARRAGRLLELDDDGHLQGAHDPEASDLLQSLLDEALPWRTLGEAQP